MKVQDLCHITIRVVDDNGIVVPDSDRIISVEVTGLGTLKGVDNGDLRRPGSYSGNSISTYFGKALTIIQSTRTRGDIVVKVGDTELPVSVLTISSK